MFLIDKEKLNELVKKQRMKNFISAYQKRELTDLEVRQKVGETKENFSNYITNKRTIAEKKLLWWGLLLGISPHEISNLPTNLLMPNPKLVTLS